MVIQTKPVQVSPPPVIITNAPTKPYVQPPETTLTAQGLAVIAQPDTGYIYSDTTGSTKVIIRIHSHTHKPPTVSAVVVPPPSQALVTDTVSGRITTVTVNKPTFGQISVIVLITLGVASIILVIIFFVSKLRVP